MREFVEYLFLFACLAFVAGVYFEIRLIREGRKELTALPRRVAQSVLWPFSTLSGGLWESDNEKKLASWAAVCFTIAVLALGAIACIELVMRR